ncbi:MAG: hypothetical protein K6F26_07600 [Lachnospiraceae bacterium]|nr:hypothetical protein [Lachnospiraceae bacterium]
MYRVDGNHPVRKKNRNMKNQSRIFFLGLLIMLFGLAGTSCKQKETKREGTLPGETTVVAEPLTELVTPLPEPWENSTHSLRWVLMFYPTVKEEDRKTINRILYERGIDCRIDFVGIPEAKTGAEYDKWIISEANADILTVNIWENAAEGFTFAKKNLLPIEDYLKTEEGRLLRDAYSETEWHRIMKGTEIYTVPRRPMPCGLGVYLSYNRKYEDYFASFDGTYDSIKRIYDTIADDDLKLVIDSLSVKMVDALLGWDTVCYGTIPYRRSDRQAVAPAEVIEAEGKLCELLYRDMKTGIIINRAIDSADYDNVLAYIYLGKREASEGYVTITLSPDAFEANNRMCYGVYRESDQQEMALKVLGICFSNPQIASILNWGESDTSKWEICRKLMAEEGANELTGFIPGLSEQSSGYLDEYCRRREEVLSDMYKVDAGGRMILNSDYTSVGILHGEDRFDSAIEELNKELDSWFSTQGGQ